MLEDGVNESRVVESKVVARERLSGKKGDTVYRWWFAQLRLVIQGKPHMYNLD